MRQEDTYFALEGKRLKLRINMPGRAELISYRRPDSLAPRLSRYTRLPQPDPWNAIATLSRRFKVRGIVKKRRTVYMIANTRIHLDTVIGLGQFVELEVILRRGWTVKIGMDIARDLADQLGLSQAKPIASSYIDLLEEARASDTTRATGDELAGQR
jgi:predicted adenylyl cyclase CyaB